MLLAAGLSTLCVIGQNVIVVMKDGTRHKFNADYVSELKFQDVAPETPPVEFKTLDVTPYSNGNVELAFTDEAGTTICNLDLYGPTDAIWLHAGNYAFSTDYEPWTFSQNYSSVTIAGTKHNVNGGNVVVTLADNVYTFDINLILENGESFKGKYTGVLGSYTQDFSVTLDAAAYSSVAQPKGQFLVKFNDQAWNYEMGIYLVADQGASKLPAGEYTYSTVGIAGALLDTSTIDDFVTHSNLKAALGSKATVTVDGENYSIVMDINLTDGRTGHFTYEGTITGTPEFIETVEPVVFDTLDEQRWGATNTTLTFGSSSDSGFALALDCYMPSAPYFTPGTYVVGASTGLYIDTDISYTFLAVDGEKTGIKSGTMTVTNEGDTYTFDMDLVLADDKAYRATYTGEIQNGPSIPDTELDLASYNENPRPAGNFYVKFQNVDYTCEMALDMFADPSALLLPAGTYVYSEDDTPGTFGSISYVDLYNPNSNNHMAEGSKVVVTETDGSYNFEMDLIFTDGRTMHLTYEGDIQGTPNFISGEVETVTFDTVNVKPYGSKNSTVEFWNASDPAMKLSLDFYGRDGSAYFQPGTYTVGGSGEMYIGVDAQYSYLGTAGSKVAVTGGTVNVTLDEDIYTFDIDLTLEDGSQYKAAYTGKLNKFGPVLGIELELSAAKYLDNARPAGNFYLKFNDADWNCEMALDMFADASATTLPAGTYNYSADGGAGTFGPSSYLDYYVGGSTNYRMAEGSVVTVTKNGDEYTIEMNLKLVDGPDAHLTFSGEITGTPVFE